MLTRRARIVLDTILPGNAHPDLRLGIFDAGFDAWYADFRKNAIFSMVIGFWAALFVAIWIAPLLIRRLPPISLYKRETRERALLALAKSDVYVFRQLYLILKANIAFCYGANREVRDALGFPVQFDDPRRRGENQPTPSRG